jgi:hypothetical protein
MFETHDVCAVFRREKSEAIAVLSFRPAGIDPLARQLLTRAIFWKTPEALPHMSSQSKE